MTVQFADDRDDPPLSGDVDASELQNLAAATLRREGLPNSVEVSITLIDEAAMAALNRTHMGLAGATDVLSFPLETLTPGSPPPPAGDGPPLYIGDVFICPAVVASNATTAQVAFADEMALMVVHGLLHLLGYDHIVDSEAEQMEQREQEMLSAVGRVRP